MGLRITPYAFTEHGAVMLAAVLNSDAAVAGHDQQFEIVFEAIRRLMDPPPEKSKPVIGFRP